VKGDWRCGLAAVGLAFTVSISGCGGGGGSSGGEVTPMPPPPPGTLDASFGVGGLVTTAIGGHAQVNAVALQPDGKILVAGYASIGGGQHQILVVRYLSDGNLDTGFGVGGKVLSSPYSGDAEAIGVALQPDGKIVVLGAGFPGALVRYTKDGVLDSGFGVGGIVSGSNGAAIGVQTDGKIVVARSGPSVNQIGAMRFNPDGTLDTSFGVGGEAVILLPPDVPNGTTSVAPSLAIQSDGKILIGGSRYFTGGLVITLHYSSLARFDTNGVLDPAFGGSGFATASLEERLTSIVLQPDGKILARLLAADWPDPFARCRAYSRTERSIPHSVSRGQRMASAVCSRCNRTGRL
jgi:uncharacterized delta-60 repeat protein